MYVKYGLRKAQAISLVNATAILTIQDGIIEQASITTGAVAPTVVHAKKVEKFLVGKKFSRHCILEASMRIKEDISPIDDLRSSAHYRVRIAEVLIKRMLSTIYDGTNQEMVPQFPITLSVTKPKTNLDSTTSVDLNDPITFNLNGNKITKTLFEDKSLLRFIREDCGLVGTKEGCAEGECGACTIYLDGNAVMSCLIPAPRAHASNILTIEGISENGFNIVQKAFVDQGAVQCGYCTPGFVMAATKLLEEKTNPTRDDILQGISGNLCRCTGYYKIIQAIELAAEGRSM
jgi:aerobic-type carbon monoxide dehydrogenase small subunit (CoxS/CutS family)